MFQMTRAASLVVFASSLATFASGSARAQQASTGLINFYNGDGSPVDVYGPY